MRKVVLLLIFGVSLAYAQEQTQTDIDRIFRQDAMLGESQKMAALIENKDANIDAQAAHGETALDYAILFGRYRTAKKLIEWGARTDLEDDSGLSPINRASSDCNAASVVRALLKSGVDVNHRDFYGRTPLMNAAREDCPKIVELLLMNSIGDIQLDAEDDAQETAESLSRGDWVSKLIQSARVYQQSGASGRTLVLPPH